MVLAIAKLRLLKFKSLRLTFTGPTTLDPKIIEVLSQESPNPAKPLDAHKNLCEALPVSNDERRIPHGRCPSAAQRTSARGIHARPESDLGMVNGETDTKGVLGAADGYRDS